MLDFGLPELLLIIAVAVLVIGPGDIPKLMYSFGRIVRRLQYMRFALSQQFEDFMQEHDLSEMRNMAAMQTKGSAEDEKDDDAAYLGAAVNDSDGGAAEDKPAASKSE